MRVEVGQSVAPARRAGAAGPAVGSASQSDGDPGVAGTHEGGAAMNGTPGTDNHINVGGAGGLATAGTHIGGARGSGRLLGGTGSDTVTEG